MQRVADLFNGAKNGSVAGRRSDIAVTVAEDIENIRMEKYNVVRLILGDQLNELHPWFDKTDPGVIYLMAEVRQETDYVAHHIQKVTGFFLAMRAFAERLRQKGHAVAYFTLNDSSNPQDFELLISRVLKVYGAEKFEYLLPDEYRLDRQLARIAAGLDVPTEVFDTHHFLTRRDELSEFFKGKKQYLMESFYRHLRRRGGWLMDSTGEPMGGQWNFDKENRHKLPLDLKVPSPLLWSRDVSGMVAMIRDSGVRTIGRIREEEFDWPVTRQEQLDLLDYFCKHLLIHFGRYQDAMHPTHWTMFHSRLSFGMNVKLISPSEVVDRAIREWESRSDQIELAQIEGFVRQIIGWREYMRGIYWARMPEFASMNFFEHRRPLPKWFWSGDTKMACARHAIEQSLDHAYAHHIQRLMVTGNLALLAGIDPDQLDEWYLGIYMDAIEWVEITNTRGMSQYADGGVVGTKPYVASANYMQKMGHYCDTCSYDPKKRTGPGACPLNSFYWNFFIKNRERLEGNPRIGMVYRTLDRMDPKVREALLAQAENYLSAFEEI